MSIHIGAEPGRIAPTVLLPGDPLRARFIADTLLEGAECFNEVRGMLGFTGRWNDRRVSVMGTGMGQPSLAIYVNELIRDYGAQTLIRVGTCGALQPGIGVGDIILPLTASTNSHVNRLRFGGMDFAPAADFELLQAAYAEARQRAGQVHVGGILSSDTFYEGRSRRVEAVGGVRHAGDRDGDLGAVHPGRPARGARPVGADRQRQPGDRRVRLGRAARARVPDDGRDRAGVRPGAVAVFRRLRGPRPGPGRKERRCTPFCGPSCC